MQDDNSFEPLEPSKPEQVIDVSADLNITPVNQDASGPIQYEDSKYKNGFSDPDKEVKDIGGGVSGSPKPPMAAPIPPGTTPLKPVAVPPVVPPIVPPEISRPAALANPQAAPSISAVPKSPPLSAMRTYEGDVASTIAKKGTSTADIAMAEKRRESGQEAVLSDKEPNNNGKKVAIAVISLILIGAGVVGAYYLYSISPLAPAPAAPAQQAVTASLVPSDTRVGFAVDGLTPNSVLSKIQAESAKPSQPNSIKEIVPYMTINGTKTRVTGPQMISLMDIAAPNILVRSISPSWMLGVYTDGSGNTSDFIVATNSFFQNAFAGMLAWENVMPDDLKQYLYPVAPLGIANAPATSTMSSYLNPLQNIDSILPLAGTTSVATSSKPKDVATSTATSTKKNVKVGAEKPKGSSITVSAMGTSTATSTASTSEDSFVAPYFTLRGQFQDRIIKNKDVREFVTSDGKVLFLYSFVDNSKLIIAGNEATLTEIITRLEKSAFVH